MACHEQVVLTLRRVGVAHQPPFGPHRLKLVVATGEQFVGIDLVARVPDQSIAAKVERRVQGDAQFDDPQIRCEMCAAASDQVAQHIANLNGQPFQLRQGEFLHVAGLGDRREDFRGHVFRCLTKSASSRKGVASSPKISKETHAFSMSFSANAWLASIPRMAG